ncbi:D-aminoacyl-tRNA deacylase [Fibrobacterota bacterium]
MKAVIQRVREAAVSINSSVKGDIQRGLLVYLGIEEDDNQSESDWLVNKIVNMRIFSDRDHLMNLSVKDIGGEILVISQFTLIADTRKGHRPSFSRAARPEAAIPLYKKFISELEARMEKPVPSGEFGADMQIHSINDGPVTIVVDTRRKE